MTATAVMCGVNQYSSAGASVCSNCSGGQVSSPGSSSCVLPSASVSVSVSPSTTTTFSSTKTASPSVSRSVTPTLSLTRTVSASPSTSAFGPQISLCPSGWAYYYDSVGIEGHDSCVWLSSTTTTITVANAACGSVAKSGKS